MIDAMIPPQTDAQVEDNVPTKLEMLDRLGLSPSDDRFADGLSKLTVREVEIVCNLCRSYPEPIRMDQLVRRMRARHGSSDVRGEPLRAKEAGTVVSRIRAKLGFACVEIISSKDGSHDLVVAGPTLLGYMDGEKLVKRILSVSSPGKHLKHTDVQEVFQGLSSTGGLKRMSQVEANPSIADVPSSVTLDDHAKILETLQNDWDLIDQLNDIEAQMAKAQSMTAECVSAVDPLVIAQTIAEHEARTLRAQAAKERSDKALTKERIVQVMFLFGILMYALYGVLWYLGRV